MTKQVGACCSSPASMCYWFAVSLMAWGVLSLIGIYWRPLHGSSAVACLFAMAIGCLANSESASRFCWNGGMRSALRHSFEDKPGISNNVGLLRVLLAT